MKGEAPMTLAELARIVAFFGSATILVTIIGFYFFLRWSKRERMRRGSQIAMARLDSDYAEIEKREN